jgi:hypothetical protein
MRKSFSAPNLSSKNKPKIVSVRSQGSLDTYAIEVLTNAPIDNIVECQLKYLAGETKEDFVACMATPPHVSSHEEELRLRRLYWQEMSESCPRVAERYQVWLRRVKKMKR